MKIPSLLCAVVIAIPLLSGCRSGPASYLAEETTKYSIEGTEKFAFSDPGVRSAITCTGLQESRDAGGHFVVVANIRNRSSGVVRVGVRCVFKDDRGFATGGETAWREISLAGQDTEAVRFATGNGLVRKYTIVVRSIQ